MEMNLVSAVRLGVIEGVEKILSLDLYSDTEKWRAFCIASEEGDLEMLKFLEGHIDSSGLGSINRAAMGALEENQPETFRYLYDKIDKSTLNFINFYSEIVEYDSDLVMEVVLNDMNEREFTTVWEYTKYSQEEYNPRVYAVLKIRDRKNKLARL
jgi:hypothetical protein